jgi:excisionase family DNA binding protein
MNNQLLASGTLVDVLDPATADLDRDAIREVARELRETPYEFELLVRTRSGRVETLPPIFAHAIASMLEEFAQGHTVALISEAEEVSTSAAAEFLGVSRPHVVKLIDTGILPGRMVGTHRRVRMTDLLTYKRSVDRRHAFLDQLAAEAQEAGLYDDPPSDFVR